MTVRRLSSKGFQFYTPLVVAAGLVFRFMFNVRPRVIIACMPKSSSTFLTDLLASYPGVRRAKLVPEFGDREQELCELRLLMAQRSGYVAQLHLRNSEWTQELIRRYRLTPVILVRNLADCVASIRDHIRKQHHFGSLIAVNSHVLSLDDDSLDAHIIQIAMPWYLNFYEGWCNTDSLMLTYEEVVEEPAQALDKILEQASVSIDEKAIDEAVTVVQDKFTRRNVGVSGRGKDLSNQNKIKLRELIDHFPSVVQNEYLVSM